MCPMITGAYECALLQSRKCPCEMVHPIFCLLKGQQNGLWLWWMMNEVKGGKGEPVRVVAVPMPMP